MRRAKKQCAITVSTKWLFCKVALFLYVLLLNIPQMQAAESKYYNIDLYARFTPAEFEESIEMLALYLIDGAEIDEEKIRAFYIWITDNISYDTKRYFNGRIPDQSAEEILKNRLSVCDGYANLFKKICDVAKIECIKISGFSKGYGYNPLRIPSEGNHAWNAVFFDGQWHLIDVTWGAGYIDENKNFVKRFSDYYFLTDPNVFIYTHLPDNHSWQLLLIPKSQDEFLKQMDLSSAWFEYGLQVSSHKQSVIIAKDSLTIRIKTPEKVILAVNLVESKNTMDDGYTFVQKKDSLTEISLIFPREDIFILNIFAKERADSGVYKQVSKYRIDALHVKKNRESFPITYNTFHQHNCYLFKPLNGVFKKGNKKQIKIYVPGASKTAVVMDDKWIFFKKESGDIFTGLIQNEHIEITVYSQFPGNEEFQALLKFQSF